MRLSKTRFINFIRCNRYCALEEIYKERDKAVVSFIEDPELEDMMSEENRDKKRYLLDDMEDEEGESILKIEDKQMETMLPYYSKIEMLAGETIKKRFKGNVIYSMDTYQQKRFEFEYEGFRFYCFLDGYQEDETSIRIFEVKATTSKKFLEMTYRNNENEKTRLFNASPSGIMMLQEDLMGDVNDDYHKKTATLKNRLSKQGRYIYDVLYQRFVLEHALKTKKPIYYYLVVLNSDYVHQGQKQSDGSIVYGDDLITFFDVTRLTESMMPVIKEDVKTVIHRLNTMQASPVSLGVHCQRKDARQCFFYPVCYKHVPEVNSLFAYLDGHHGFKDENNVRHERYDLLNEGFIHMTDIPHTWLNRLNNRIQRQVIDAETPYINASKIRDGLSEIRYPVYHLDFETFPCPLPRFKGEKPYSQSLFQFSVHIEREPGVCNKDSDNVSFIAKTHDDLRQELIEALLQVIKDDQGTVMVYNESFEKTRLKEMGQIFPAHKERLDDIASRLFDLMVLVKTNSKLYQRLGYDEEEAKAINYYHHDLNGSYSIKKVLPLFSPLSYKGMSIGNGTQALMAYANFPKMDQATFEQTYNDLLAYCKQDTWAMFEILNGLRSLVG